MSEKLEVDRLSRDKLVYELNIRGVEDVTTVQAMRKSLRYLLRAEKSSSFSLPEYPYTFQEDVAALSEKVEEISSLLKEFLGNKTTPEYKKLSAKLTHCLGRANRCPMDGIDAALRKERTKLFSRLVTLQSELQTKADARRISSTLLSTVLEQAFSEVGEGDNLSGIATSDSESEEESCHRKLSFKSVPAAHWNVKFSGDPKSMSVGAFLERIEELRVARNVSKHQLIRSAIDIFEGSALIWYRSVRSTYDTWDELAIALREEFQPPDYQEKLFEEIKRRTQGPNERIGIYIAYMNSLFARLKVKLSEHTKLKILQRNIAPFYQAHLGVVEIDSVATLQKFCNRIEERKAAVDSYLPPPRKNQSMEPDLACVDIESMPSCSSLVVDRDQNDDSSRRLGRRCWNCKKEGHLSVNCQAPRKLYCFKCGNPNFTVRSCPKCRSGNFRQTQ